MTDMRIPWRLLATRAPELVQWRVQTKGPIPDDDPGVNEDEYLALVSEYTDWATS
jgi:hypothetical protein